MKTQTIAANSVSTICWSNDSIVDWASSGIQYSIDNQQKQLGRAHYGSLFNSAIISANGQYAFICYKLGTKGLLLKDGEVLREIDRSYYCAQVYEYPATFITINDKTYLIHCPKSYCRIDIEDVETGEIITDVPDRAPSDTFYSRFEISPENTFLMSRGWNWHPVDMVYVFNIDNCLKNPLLLDRSNLSPDWETEICTASFINDRQVLIGSSNEVFDEELENPPVKSIGIWDLESDQISPFVKVDGEFGNLFAISEKFAWDTFRYPKIINIKTGAIVDKDESVNSGEQNSSIIGNNTPQIVFNKKTKQLALKKENEIIVLTPPDFAL